MVSKELSNYLEVSLMQSKDGESNGGTDDACRDCAATPRRVKRLDDLKLCRVKTDRDGTGEDELVRCLSFRRASSLGIVVLLLSTGMLLDVTALFVVIGAAASTVCMANEIRHETLERRRENQDLRQSMYETSLELKLAMRQLELAEQRLGLAMPRSPLAIEEGPESLL